MQEEIVARYPTFEGSPEEQTWEMCQDYFIRSPNIDNMHGTPLEIGWDAYRNGSVAYYRWPAEGRPAVRFDNLQVRIIDERTVWVRGVYVNAYEGRELRPIFYDMLVKTEDGWQVFRSYVERPG